MGESASDPMMMMMMNPFRIAAVGRWYGLNLSKLSLLARRPANSVSIPKFSKY